MSQKHWALAFVDPLDWADKRSLRGFISIDDVDGHDLAYRAFLYAAQNILFGVLTVETDLTDSSDVEAILERDDNVIRYMPITL